MLNTSTTAVLAAARENGWVLEPDAKAILAAAGIDVPRHHLAASDGDAAAFAEQIGYPVVAKVVSPAVMHKTDQGGVILGIDTVAGLTAAYDRFSRMDRFAGMLVEETVAGVELIIGAQIDGQFGPVVLLGIGGIGVELYNDTAIRMAPVTAADVHSMVRQLKGRKLLTGFRGSPPVDMAALTDLVVRFSGLVMDMAPQITSIDLNPVMCTADRCVVADARILLAEPA